MASIRKIETKKGFYYRITVSEGRDAEYKQIRHYKTWKPPAGMGVRQAGKMVKQIAVEFENELEYGFQPDCEQTFDEYAAYVIQLKEQRGAKPGTLHVDESLRRRCYQRIGYMKIVDIRPRHLNEFYMELSRPGSLKSWNSSTAAVDLSAIVAASGKSKSAFAQSCGVTFNTLKNACDGATISLQCAQRIADYLRKPVDDVFTVDRSKRALSPKMIKSIHQFIHDVLHTAEIEMLIKYNPADKVQPPKVPRKTPNYFQPEQIAAILQALETEPIMWRVMVTLMIMTGARRGEVAALKWEKIDFGRSELKLDASLSYLPEKGIYEGTTKTGNTRYISLPSEIMALLRRYRLWQMERRLSLGDKWIESDYLFTQLYGGPINPTSVNRWLAKFTERNGLPHINPHAFRHSAASIMISNGCDIMSVAAVLGHSTPKTTMEIYTHQITESTRHATECLTDAILKKA